MGFWHNFLFLRMGNLLADRFLMVYDLRTLRALPLVPLSIPPTFCRFLPSYSDSRIMVASQVRVIFSSL